MNRRGWTLFPFAAAMLAAAIFFAPAAHAQTNTSLGTDALAGSTGTYDTAVGFSAAGAGPNQQTGITALGAGALEENTTGAANTATGYAALLSNQSGSNNTAIGFEALNNSNTTGNTAIGAFALQNTNTGANNTASGYLALQANTSGTQNTAAGVNSLENNTNGNYNTADGLGTLEKNIAGSNNTAVGINALLFDTASQNTGLGANALQTNTSGANNTAVGYNSLLKSATAANNSALGASVLVSDTTGYSNTAMGFTAMQKNTTGFRNSALGVNALLNNTTGQNNLGLGYFGGANLTIGSNNIDIANNGAAGEANTTRVGTQGTQTAIYLAGITSSAVSGSDVMVNSSGKLGLLVSSARYKRDIHEMGASSEALMKLRPVSFKYKDDRQGIKQYGLVAEEVEKVYPELVTYDSDGRVQTVHYYALTSMLLNELQKQVKENQHQATLLANLSTQLASEKSSRQRDIKQLRTEQARELTTIRASFEQRLSSLEQTIEARDGNHKFEAASIK